MNCYVDLIIILNKQFYGQKYILLNVNDKISFHSELSIKNFRQNAIYFANNRKNISN